VTSKLGARTAKACAMVESLVQAAKDMEISNQRWKRG
jgi:hypothetical protein